MSKRPPPNPNGRPPLDPADALTAVVHVRFRPGERDELDAAVAAYNARLTGDAVRMTRAEFVRSAALALAR